MHKYAVLGSAHLRKCGLNQCSECWNQSKVALMHEEEDLHIPSRSINSL